jgi:hypothetical protein
MIRRTPSLRNDSFGRAEKAGSVSPAQVKEVKAKAKAKLGGKAGTHNKDGVMMHDSMSPYHHDGITHDSGDR